jgi:hypothetical protein
MKFDNIIPLGDNCAISIILKELGLRTKSYPFDWILHVGPNPTYSIIEHNIKLFLELLEIGDIENITNKLLGDYIDENNKINGDFIFPHETGSKEYIKNKYLRRFQRLYNDVIDKNNNNLFIIITRCFLVDGNIINNLYDKLIDINTNNKIIFVSGFEQNIIQKSNLEYKYIFYDGTKGFEPNHTIFRPQLKNYLQNEINKKNIIFVTAYKDIKRNNWSNYSRTNNEYFNSFLKLTQYIDFNLVVYLEDDIFKELSKFKYNSNIIFKNLNDVNTFFDKYLQNEQLIISSECYKNKIPYSRKTNPEHVYAEYTLINHSKVNFISNTKKIFNYDFYAWIDFGYVKDILSIPIRKNINASLLPEKIIYHYLKYPDLNNIINPNDMLKSEDIYLTGSSFIVPNSLVENFEILYENKIKNFQYDYICDDDQNLVLQLYYDNHNLFHIIYDEKWFSLFCILPR